MSPGRCNVVESSRGGLEEEVRSGSGSGKVKVGLGGKYIIMAEKTAGEKIQILKKIERGQRTARPGEGGEGVFLVFWGYIAEKAISGLGGLATHPGYRCTVYGVLCTSSYCVPMSVLCNKPCKVRR